MAILITGFTPFAGVAENPSALVARAVATLPRLAGHVTAAVLPTEYERGAQMLLDLLAADRFDACISLGVSGGVVISIERWAWNADDCNAPDNTGLVRVGVPIQAGGAAAIPSTLPVETLHDAVASLGLPVQLSDDPGRFVCNHVFYEAAAALAARGSRTRYGFIHIPMHLETSVDGAGLPLQTMIAAIGACALSILDAS